MQRLQSACESALCTLDEPRDLMFKGGGEEKTAESGKSWRLGSDALD
jgi:hypothetical protein